MDKRTDPIEIIARVDDSRERAFEIWMHLATKAGWAVTVESTSLDRPGTTCGVVEIEGLRYRIQHGPRVRRRVATVPAGTHAIAAVVQLTTVGSGSEVAWGHLFGAAAWAEPILDEGQPYSPPQGVRTATPADAAAMLELAVAFYAEDGFTTTRDRLADHLRHLLSSSDAHCAVIDEADSVVAFGITTSSYGLENGLIAELEDLYVAPRARRHGLAQALIDDSSRWARRRGAAKLEIVIAPNGLDVSHLDRYYRARGFRDDGRRLLELPLTE